MDIQHMIEWMQHDRDNNNSIFELKVDDSRRVNAIFWMTKIMVMCMYAICSNNMQQVGQS
jgi:hypothetical protein